MKTWRGVEQHEEEILEALADKILEILGLKKERKVLRKSNWTVEWMVKYTKGRGKKSYCGLG